MKVSLITINKKQNDIIAQNGQILAEFRLMNFSA